MRGETNRERDDATVTRKRRLEQYAVVVESAHVYTYVYVRGKYNGREVVTARVSEREREREIEKETPGCYSGGDFRAWCVLYRRDYGCAVCSDFCTGDRKVFLGCGCMQI